MYYKLPTGVISGEYFDRSRDRVTQTQAVIRILARETKRIALEGYRN